MGNEILSVLIIVFCTFVKYEIKYYSRKTILLIRSTQSTLIVSRLIDLIVYEVNISARFFVGI